MLPRRLVDWRVNDTVRADLSWRTEDHSSPRPVDLGNLPVRRDGRALKRWRYVGVFGAERMLCVGLAHVGGVPQAWWAVWDRGAGSLRERTIFARPRAIVRFGAGPGRVTVRDRDVRIDLELDEGPGVETVCPHGGGTGWIWTRKQAGIAARGSVQLGERAFAVDGLAVVDDTAGYHAPPHRLALVGGGRPHRRRAGRGLEPRQRRQRPAARQRAHRVAG